MPAPHTTNAKGQSSRLVIWRDALKNAILPVVTVIGIEFAFLIGGLVVTETVFNLPGVARFLVDAILWRDYPVVLGTLYLFTLIGLVTKLISDLCYLWVDPRVKFDR